jgi:hypothetical protein
MSHVDDGRLNALLDGELDAAEAEAVRAHIADCAECARRLEEAKQFLAGAADLLGALDLPVSASAPAAPARRVSKTAREVAIDIDGATQKSPAIRPNLPEPAPAARPRFDFSTLSWAAMVVLAIGVGYLASEVRHVRSAPAAGEGATGQERAVPIGAPAPAQPRPHAGASAAALKGGTEGRSPATAAARPAPVRSGVAAKSAAPPAGKHLVTTARPTTARRHAAAPTALAAGAAAHPQEPVPAAPAALPAALAANRPAAGAAQELAVSGVVAPRESTTAFRRVTLEEAVARLDGVIRLMDGMRFVHVELGPGSLVPGADRNRQLVRLLYHDAAGRQLVLDQQRITIPAGGGVVSPDIGMRPGDTLTTSTPEGEVRVRWISGSFWLSLTGNLPLDELRRLTERVR